MDPLKGPTYPVVDSEGKLVAEYAIAAKSGYVFT